MTANNPLRILSTVCVIVFIFGLNSASIGAGKLSASHALDIIATKGAKPALNQFWNDPPTWTHIWNSIVTGDPEWLKVAVKLKSVSDAGSTGMLRSAVSLAFINNARTVFQLPSSVYPPEGYCTYMQTEVPSYGNAELLSRKEKAATSVKDPSLATLRVRCLKTIREAKKELKELEASNQ